MPESRSGATQMYYRSIQRIRRVNKSAGGVIIGYLAAYGLWNCVLAHPQVQPPPRLRFDVAAIKPVDPAVSQAAAIGQQRSEELMDSLVPQGRIPAQHGRVTIQNRSLKSLIAAAYHTSASQVVGPPWLGDQRFYIAAEFPGNLPSNSAYEMMQLLLEERFNLQVHREMRTVPGYELVVGSKEVLLKSATPPASANAAQENISASDAATGALATAERSAVGRGGSSATGQHFSNVSMAIFAKLLTQIAHAPVVDLTSLHGTYDINLQFPWTDSGDDRLEGGLADALAPLGLKLKRAKVPLEMLVVDSVNKVPTPN